MLFSLQGSRKHSFSKAAYDAALFEPVYGRMLLAGERSGGLENVLRRITDHLRENTISQVDRLVGIVDPLLSGILMVTVGLTLLSVMLPLIGIMNSIG
jgi:type IV pilus assembly protein PilC